jgi:hypothetical protein
MFTKTLLPDTLRAIKLVSSNQTVKQAYLAGGTALALQLGHRISIDLDFFTDIKFNEQSLSAELSELPSYEEEGNSWQTVWGKINETKFSIFYYKYPLIEEVKNFEGLKIASTKDIAAMKINALEDRGTKRDFIDVYFLSKTFTLDQMLEFYNQKYSSLNDHLYSILRSLSYFEDADQDETPNMIIPIEWEEVKQFFIGESKRLWEKYK